MLPQIGIGIPTAGMFNAKTNKMGVTMMAKAVLLHNSQLPFFEILLVVKYASTCDLSSLKKSLPLLVNCKGLVAIDDLNKLTPKMPKIRHHSIT